MTAINFTPEQNHVLECLDSWLKHSEDSTGNFSAYAGCGKTTIVSHFISLQPSDVDITLVAPTHAALMQLRKRLPDVPLTVAFKTVAQVLGKIPVADNTKARPDFVKLRGTKLKGLVIVDESSMLSASDVKDLIATLEDEAKILFVGDPAQLPPVKQVSGKAILADITNQFTLSKIMRADNDIARQSTEARHNPYYQPATSDDGSVFTYESPTLLEEAFMAKLSECKPGEAVWISRTNAEVNAMNFKAHQYVTGRDYLAPSDSLRLNSSSQLGKNNTIVEIATIEPSSLGFIITTTDKPEVRVEISTPESYSKNVQPHINRITQNFKDGLGNDALAAELEQYRSVAPVSYVYAVTTHKSQGDSIKYVFANMKNIFGTAAKYVAISRASIELHCTLKTIVAQCEGTQWMHKATGTVLEIASESLYNASAVLSAIKAQAEVQAELPVPSLSHIGCVLNPSHASKSAKGWVLC